MIATPTKPVKGQRARYLAIDNKCMYRDAKVVKGFIYRANKWVAVEDLEVPANTVIKAGSLFEIAASNSRVKNWFAEGTVAPGDAVRHFNMNAVFEEVLVPKLSLYGINCLEDVATELDAIVPGSEFGHADKQPTTMPLRALLTELHNGDETLGIAEIAKAKQIVNAASVPGVLES